MDMKANRLPLVPTGIALVGMAVFAPMMVQKAFPFTWPSSPAPTYHEARTRAVPPTIADGTYTATRGSQTMIVRIGGLGNGSCQYQIETSGKDAGGFDTAYKGDWIKLEHCTEKGLKRAIEDRFKRWGSLKKWQEFIKHIITTLNFIPK